jgi:hypothetical protein
MMEALSSSGTSVLTRATRPKTPEDGIFHNYNRENLRSYAVRMKFAAAYFTALARIRKERFRSYRLAANAYQVDLERGLQALSFASVCCARLQMSPPTNCQFFLRRCVDVLPCFRLHFKASLRRLGYGRTLV